jgi:tetratricopeptide (TPR) repeat protein
MEQRFDLRIYVWALCAASSAYLCLGRWDEAIKEGREAMRLAEEFSDNSLISFAAGFITLSYALKGDLDRAFKYGEMAVETAPTPSDIMQAQTFFTAALIRAGELQRAIETLTALIPIYRSAGYRAVQIRGLVWLGDAYRRAGEHDKAMQNLEEGLELAEQCEYKQFIGIAHRLLGEVALETHPSKTNTLE